MNPFGWRMFRDTEALNGHKIKCFPINKDTKSWTTKFLNLLCGLLEDTFHFFLSTEKEKRWKKLRTFQRTLKLMKIFLFNY